MLFLFWRASYRSTDLSVIVELYNPLATGKKVEQRENESTRKRTGLET